MNINLTRQQERIVAAGITTLGGMVVVAAIVILAVLTARFFQAFDSVFLPLAVAAVLAMVLDPWYEWLRSRGLPSVIALVVVFISIVLPFAAMLIFFGALISSQLIDLLEQLPSLWERLVTWLKANQPNIDRFFRENTVGAKSPKP